jgi:amidase
VSKLALCIGVVAIVAGIVCASAHARTVALDEATIADLNAAFDAGTLAAEKRVVLCLAGIAAYDGQGPQLRAVLVLHPKALKTARALDVERQERGRRSPFHGIPVVLKDNIDTHDMPTTGGSLQLEGSMRPDDAYVVKRLLGVVLAASGGSSNAANVPNLAGFIELVIPAGFASDDLPVGTSFWAVRSASRRSWH